MQLTKIEKNGIACAVVNSNEIVITDAQSALDVLMSAKYDIGTKNIVVDKKLITEDFFILSKGLAGEILQKCVNYGGRIYESNKGKDVFFVTTRDEAVEMLTR